MTYKQMLVHFIMWWALYGAIIAVAIYFNVERAAMIGFAGSGVGAQITIERKRREHAQDMKTMQRYVDRLLTRKAQ